MVPVFINCALQRIGAKSRRLKAMATLAARAILAAFMAAFLLRISPGLLRTILHHEVTENKPIDQLLIDNLGYSIIFLIESARTCGTDDPGCSRLFQVQTAPRTACAVFRRNFVQPPVGSRLTSRNV